MFRAYLENLSRLKLKRKNNFKTYVFAAAMVGNKEFATEYNTKYASKQSSFNIVNPSDKIPKLPFSYNEPNSITENLNTFMQDKEASSLSKIFSNGLVQILKDCGNKSMGYLCTRVSKQIAKEEGPFEMPDQVENISYCGLDNLIEIAPAVFPKILKDSVLIQNAAKIISLKKEVDGHFQNKKLYKKEAWMYQHKPYSYYTSILQMYFPDEYISLKRKYLLED